jgi:hypothetical protein
MERASTEKVSMKIIKDHLKSAYILQNSQRLRDSEASEILLNLKAYGVISVIEERHKITDPYFVELRLFIDEIKNAYEEELVQ